MQTPKLDKFLNYDIFLNLNEYVSEDYEIEYFNWESYGLTGNELTKEGDFSEFKNELTTNLDDKSIDIKKTILKLYFELISEKLIFIKAHHNHNSRVNPKKNKNNVVEIRVEKIYNQILSIITDIAIENSITAFDLYADNPISQIKTKNTEKTQKLVSEESLGKSETKTNPYQQIFVDYNSFLFFETLHAKYKNSKTKLAFFSFIYWQMQKDKLIYSHYKPETFRFWLRDTIGTDVKHQFKAYDRCSTTTKKEEYDLIKKTIYNK